MTTSDIDRNFLSIDIPKQNETLHCYSLKFFIKS